MDPKERFSIRANDYVKYRPTYPTEAINYIFDTFELTNDSFVADIGSGTGKFTELFANRVRTIYGVEPNKEMREAAELSLKGQTNYKSVNGDSEHTNLDSNSIDAVVCAQAFHWFNVEKTKIEFLRIIKQKKQTALIWNIRDIKDPFFSEYEKLLIKYCNNYIDAAHNRDFDKISGTFFTQHKKVIFHHHLYYDFESVCGLLNSSSYCPMPNEKNHKPLFDDMKQLFEKYQVNNKVTFVYETMLYIGTL
jgi:ubiquinone/menaquinone biosynthesis C-methylase UbiE